MKVTGVEINCKVANESSCVSVLEVENYPLDVSYHSNQLWFGDKMGNLNLMDTSLGKFELVQVRVLLCTLCDDDGILMMMVMMIIMVMMMMDIRLLGKFELVQVGVLLCTLCDDDSGGDDILMMMVIMILLVMMMMDITLGKFELVQCCFAP